MDLSPVIKALTDKKLAAGACLAFKEFASSPSLMPFVVQNLPKLIEALNDKQKPVVSAAKEALTAITDKMPVWAIGQVLPMLMGGMKGKPAQKEACVAVVASVAKRGKVQVGACLVELLPAVSELVWDVKKEVKAAALDALEAICHCSGNKDLEVFIPTVTKSIQQPDSMAESIESLSSCVFVQEVEAPALAVLIPVLVRGLNFDKVDVKRKCCIIIENMCKLVEKPREVRPLMPKVKPLLEKEKEGISDPEARAVCERAYTELCKVIKQMEEIEMSEAAVKGYLTANGVADGNGCLDYCTGICVGLSLAACWEDSEWSAALAGTMDDAKLATVVPAVLAKCKVASAPKVQEWEDSPGPDLAKAEFGLAYGSLTLLNTTRLHLKKHQFYGLLGPNNCGKTTLMRAIAAEQVDGFPKRDELRTIFVEHEIQEREVGEDEEGFPILNIDLTGIEWVKDTVNNVYGKVPQVTSEQCAETLEEIGFGNKARGVGGDRAADASMVMTSYSGGWKMKMQLGAALLVEADLLMLDEPTGHLDVTNIEWLKNWLRSFMKKGGSCIATSHDTGFLNEMCDSIVDFQDRKLRQFRGNKGAVLKEFVDTYPEKAGYFELKNDVVKFSFPVPGSLEGVKSKSKALVKLTNVTFQYPTRTTPTIFDVNLAASRVSRVAVIGANGAGKSTAIKILIGELKATKGEVYRHPNLRLAYIAQHAFQHLEKHLTQTPTQYILERFAGNDDKENIEFKAKANAQEVAVKKKFFINPATNALKVCEEAKEEAKAIVVEAVLARRENKKEKVKEYQVKLQFKPVEDAIWISRDIMVSMGHLALVQRQDEKEAVAAGLQSKMLTSEGVEKHLMNFGLDKETASHTTIQSLSGGQKVKVVLGASMWQDPHIVVLDEPTNYLDRDGLGALTKAIEEFEGGVIIISHNKEFCGAVATEKWIMKAGLLQQEGESVEKAAKEAAGTGNKEEEEVRDAAGNIIDMKKEAKLSDKEKKKEIKDLEKKLKDGKKKKTLTEDDIWEMEDKLAALNKELEESKAAAKA